MQETTIDEIIEKAKGNVRFTSPEAIQIAKSAMEKARGLYPDIYLASAHAQACMDIYSLIGPLAGKRILDVGCGATGGRDHSPPTFARVLGCTDAEVIGIDKFPDESKTYQHITTDLIYNNIPDLVEGKFDVVIANSFLSSPHLWFSLERLGIDKKTFNSKIINQINEVLKDKGPFFTDDLCIGIEKLFIDGNDLNPSTFGFFDYTKLWIKKPNNFC